jgi:tetratricopeptide (TPR) repeat protein
MSRTILILLFFTSITVLGQDRSGLEHQIYDLKNKGGFEEITILTRNLSPLEFSDSTNATIGFCFIDLDDSKAHIHLKEALKGSPKDAKLLFLSSNALFNLERYEESLNLINSAIILNPSEPFYYALKADIFFKDDRVDSALYYYHISTSFDDFPIYSLLRQAQIYYALGSNEKALEIYQHCLKIAPKDSEDYADCLYSLGLIELFNDKAESAEIHFKSLNEMFPDNFFIITRVIQALYINTKYSEAAKYKKQLYQERTNGFLPEELSSSFFMDYFIYKGKKVYVYEYFDEPEDKLYYKHVFYIKDDVEVDEYTIQTEHSQSLKKMNKKYVLGRNRDGMHSSFFQYVFNEEFDYDFLKTCVKEIIDGKIDPSSTSSSRKKEPLKKGKKKRTIN